MPFVKIITSIALLFVSINLMMTIYNSINRTWRENFETQNNFHPPSSNNSCQNY
jgi:hypothetical protein